MNVIHLPTLVGNNSWHLSRGERALGLSSDVLAHSKHFLAYPYDYNLDLDSKNHAKKLFDLVKTFFWIQKKYNVLHFNYGSSLFHIPARGLIQSELPLYTRDKKIFVTYQGCDARQKFPTMERSRIAACHESDCYGGQCNSGVLDQQRKVAIQKMSRRANFMWALNPDLLNFLPPEKSGFLPYAIDVPTMSAGSGSSENRKLRILHAPTDRGLKGSRFIVSALNELKLRYPNDVEIVLVEKMVNSDFLNVLKTCDLLVDQTLIGWYGAISIESMLLGVPVAVRISKEDLRYVPPQMADEILEAAILIEPSSIADTISLYVENRSLLRKHREAGLEYARRWHDPKYVASLTRSRYEA